MHKARIDWNHFRTALAVARTGNLSSAAKLLDINQSTASRHLAALEAEIGAALFLRSRAATEITETGRAIVAKAEAMESAVLDAFDGVGQPDTEITGLIRYVAVPWITHALVAPNLSSFWERCPKVEIQSIGDTRERALEKGEVDISLRFDPQRGETVDKVAIAQISYSVYALREAEPGALPWLGFREDQLRTEVESWLIEASRGEDVRFWANDAGILHQGVRAGAGKALLPDYLAATDPQLVCLAAGQVERPLWLQVMPEVRRLRRVALFIDWLTDLANKAFTVQEMSDERNAAVHGTRRGQPDGRR